MTKSPVTNVAASVLARLGNLARTSGRRHQDIVMGYALERWLYRLSLSPHADQFVLKGALMLVVWRIPTTRPTRDIDLLARTSNNLDAVRELVAEICRTPVPDDGLSFDAEKVTTTRIAEDALYEGVRATFPGAISSTRVAMQLDLGFSDLITPGPDRITFPCLLGHAPPVLAAYNRETAIAEKYEAMVKLGELNSRMKDFFDIWALARSGSFEGAVLSAAIRQTFAHRETGQDLAAVCFSEAFGLDHNRQSQWAAFIKRSAITQAPASFNEIVTQVRAFLLPITEAEVRQKPFVAKWPPGGPWGIP